MPFDLRRGSPNEKSRASSNFCDQSFRRIAMVFTGERILHYIKHWRVCSVRQRLAGRYRQFLFARLFGIEFHIQQRLRERPQQLEWPVLFFIHQYGVKRQPVQRKFELYTRLAVRIDELRFRFRGQYLGHDQYVVHLQFVDWVDDQSDGRRYCF